MRGIVAAATEKRARIVTLSEVSHRARERCTDEIFVVLKFGE
jgi:hypothetical protein